MEFNDPLKTVDNIFQFQHVREPPGFPAVPTPRAYRAPPVFFANWVAARDKAAAALFGGTKRLLLTGPAGTGKTVLIEHVACILRAAGRPVVVQLADTDPEPPGAGATLFVDEADRLSEAKLRQLFDQAAGTVVLAGLSPLARRVAVGTAQMTLAPLGQTAAREYIAQWLALNGHTSAELDGMAVRSLVELSGGVPRLLSTLLAAGAWLAESSGASVIDAGHIQEAAELRSVVGPPSSPTVDVATSPPARRRMGRWSVLLGCAVLIAAAAALVPRWLPVETARAVAFVTPFAEGAGQWLRGDADRPPSHPSRP